MSLKRSLSVKIKDNNYVVNYPSVGQFLDIESSKVNLTRGAFGEMVRSGTNKALDAVLMAEVIAHFIVLLPELNENLKAKNLSSLDIVDFVELVKVYKGEIKPWIDGWYKVYNEAIEKVKDDKEEKGEE